MERSDGRTVLVTGGYGFIGSHLVERLLAQGARVRGLLRPPRSREVFSGRPVEIVRGDLRDEGALMEAVRGVDRVYHVAGLIAARGPAEFRAVNRDGTRRLAECVRRGAPRCRRFVYVSSQAAAGPSRDGVPVDESAPGRPVTDYGRSKLEGEHALVQALGPVPCTVV
ncbi:MAG: NAD-dependent epimerase/dehydratase family protein, partial [Planctomycetota bacterium]